MYERYITYGNFVTDSPHSFFSLSLLVRRRQPCSFCIKPSSLVNSDAKFPLATINFSLCCALIKLSLFLRELVYPSATYNAENTSLCRKRWAHRLVSWFYKEEKKKFIASFNCIAIKKFILEFFFLAMETMCLIFHWNSRNTFFEVIHYVTS